MLLPVSSPMDKTMKKQMPYQVVDEIIRGNEFIICGRDTSLEHKEGIY